MLVAAIGVGACATGEKLDSSSRGALPNDAVDSAGSGAATSSGGALGTGGGPSSGGAITGGSGGTVTAGAGGATTGGTAGTGGASNLDGGPTLDASIDGSAGGAAGSGTGGTTGTGGAGSGTGGTGGTGGGTCSGSINIRNDVMDARDRLHIRGAEMWWEHFTPGEFPGEHNNRNTPSYITSDQAGSANAAVTWCPVFGTCNVCNSSCSPSAISSVPFVLSPPQFPLPVGDLTVTLTITTGRNAVTIVQQPSVANAGELIIEFNDTSSGASSYNVTASYTSASPCSP